MVSKKKAAPPPSTSSYDWTKVNITFKNPTFEHAYKASSKNKKNWRTLKQIISSEATSSDVITYSSIDAPPSFVPAKKYSDLSGLPANYTDPQTKLNFANSDEFKLLRKLPGDIVAGYLTLRRANTQLQ